MTILKVSRDKQLVMLIGIRRPHKNYNLIFSRNFKELKGTGTKHQSADRETKTKTKTKKDKPKQP